MGKLREHLGTQRQTDRLTGGGEEGGKGSYRVSMLAAKKCTILNMLINCKPNVQIKISKHTLKYPVPFH